MLDFLIMYEVRVRELESVILLGTELKKRGYSVEYLSFDDVDQNKYIKNRKLLKKYHNNVNVVLVPSLYHNNEVYNTVYYVCGRCQKIVNLRWEQYFINKVMVDPDSYLFPHEDAKNAIHLCWGKRSYDSLIACGIKKENLRLVGALQLDFLRPEFKPFYLSKMELFSKYGISTNKSSVLYISSFSTATRTERSFAAVQKDFNNGYNEDERVYSFHKKSYELTLKWIENFLKIHKDIEFIYRPHPSENVTNLIENICKKNNNFRIIADYSVKQWILTCDVIATWVSTSIVEAFFADKACFIVRPIAYPNDIDMSVYQDAKFINNEKDFLKIAEEKCEISVSKSIMHEFYEVGKEAAYLKYAEELEKILNTNSSFLWNQFEVEKFEKKRRKLFIRNIVFYLYLICLKISYQLHSKCGITFSKKWNDRIKNYSAVIKKAKLDKVNNTNFDNIENRIRDILNRKI